jgi:hypothetical protein
MSEHEGGAKTADDPHHDLRTIRFLSFILIVLGLLGGGPLALIFFSLYLRERSLDYALYAFGPPLYLAAFFFSCLSFVRGRALVALCVVFNAPLALLIIVLLAHLSWPGVVLPVFPVMWTLLCAERLRLERTPPTGNRAARRPAKMHGRDGGG